MLGNKSTISARVSNTLKEVVVDSEYSHKEAYELGAGLIAVNKAEETKTELEHDPTYEKAIREKKTKLLKFKVNVFIVNIQNPLHSRMYPCL